VTPERMWKCWHTSGEKRRKKCVHLFCLYKYN